MLAKAMRAILGGSSAALFLAFLAAPNLVEIGVGQLAFAVFSSQDKIFDGVENPLGDGTDSELNMKRIRPTIEAIRTKLGLPNTAEGRSQALNELKKARANVAKAIDLLKLHDATIGASYQRLLNKGLIGLDFGTGDHAGSAQGDGSREFSLKDKVNIKFTSVPRQDVPAHDPAMIILVRILHHEGIHATHEKLRAPEIQDSVLRAVKEQFEDHYLDELRAYDADKRLMTDLLNGVRRLGRDTTAPEPQSDYTREIVRLIGQLTQDERGSLIQKLRDNFLPGLIAHSQKQIDLNTASIETIRRFLNDPGQPGPERSQRLKQMFKDLGLKKPSQSPGLPPIKDLALVPQPNGRISQLRLTGGEPIELETFFSQVMDTEVLPSGRVLLVSGLSATGDTGGVVGFSDLNQDGLFTQDEFFSAVPLTTQLQSNLDIFIRPTTEDAYIYDAVSGAIYLLIDSDNSGLPDQLGSNIARFVTIPDEFVEFQIAPNGILWGASFPLDEAPDFGVLPDSSMNVLRLADTDSDGLLDTAHVLPHSDVIAFQPVILTGLTAGMQVIELQATKNSSVEIVSVDTQGNVIEVLARSMVPSTAPMELQLGRGLVAGELIVPRDTTLAVDGPAELVSPVVGGIGFFPDRRDPSAPNWAVIAGIAAGAAAGGVALGSAAWYTRRRWVR